MMKKNVRIIICTAAAISTAFAVHKVTKRKQKEAEKKGEHVSCGACEVVGASG